MQTQRHRVVIIGGGFGGLYAAKRLGRCNVDLTLVDRRNFHLFQPLLYQVATGGLSPGDISSPLRAVLGKNTNTRVWQAEATDIDAERSEVVLRDGRVAYDTLVVATGASHAYFGNDAWAAFAPGLKTVEDALDIRRRIFLAFEAAEREPDPALRRSWMNFVVVGGGPTGVELSGAIAELAHATLRRDFKSIRSAEARVLLIEGVDRVLPTYPSKLSRRAARSLRKLGVEVRTDTRVTDIRDGRVTMSKSDATDTIDTRTILWAAGVRPSALGEVLARAVGAPLDRVGRVMVEPDLTVPEHPNIFVIGDLANFTHYGGAQLPGVAPVAIQQGDYVARVIDNRLRGGRTRPFRYVDKGNLAVIGRAAAVADMGRLQFWGYPAWLTWVFVHIAYLIEFDNKLIVLINWAFDYFTRKRGARLITGKDPQPLVRTHPGQMEGGQE